MNLFFILLISSLSVFRGAEFLAMDNGPFHICKKLRESCRGHPILCELVTCQYCIGSYLSMVCVAILWRTDMLFSVSVILWWAGIWGGQAAILRSVRERV